ncbi:ATPase [Aureococcus anophagefferens]|nr:ATPase [Aureococcus anophagefferens]
MMQAEGEIDYTNMNPGIASSIKNNPRLQQKIKNMKVRQAEFEAEKKEIMRSGRVQQNCKWQWTDWDDEGKCTTKEIFVHIQLPKGTTKEQLRIKTLRQLFEVKVLAPNSNGIEKRLSARPDVAAVDAPQKIVQALGNTDVGIHADYTSADAGEERKKALLARHKLDEYKDDNKLNNALAKSNEWRASWRMASHTAMLDCISAGGTSRARSPAVLAVLRHDLELAKVEDRLEDAINFDKALEAAGAPKPGSAAMEKMYKDTELQKRKEAFVAKVRAQAGLPAEVAEQPKDLISILTAPEPKRVDTVLLRGDLFMPLDVEGTVWHIEGQWLKMELTKDGMAGFEWPNPSRPTSSATRGQALRDDRRPALRTPRARPAAARAALAPGGPVRRGS